MLNIDSKTLDGLLESVERLRIAVIGDVMLDRFIFGRVDRISPEAPVPVVHVRAEEERLGGAANVAANLRGLQAQVDLFGVVGPGEHGRTIVDAAAELGIGTEGIIACEGRVSAVKTRILAGSQQVVRIDRESKGRLSDADCQRLFASIDEQGPFDAFVVSDYGKGVVGTELMDQMREQRAAGRVVVVDPKQGNFDLYRGVSCATPNAREAASACHDLVESDEDALRVGLALRARLESDMLLITRGEHGMSLFRDATEPVHLPTEAREVYDVTGAGDTVIACFTAFLAAGAAPESAAALANSAAGIVVREIGTAAVTPAALCAAWSKRGGATS